MQNAKAISWECGECGLGVDAGEAFAWCDGCSKLVCEECLDDAGLCDRCDLVVCKHCSLRRFTLSCEGCGLDLHTDCPRGSANALCEACTEEASTLLAS
ncbi:MAG TPA: hypothetical protein VE549_05360 [Myxococcaceae bacterium]|jgi:hypothetical protein|nr:hypothetical protein [Myxococcaceae bacterium]